LVVGGVDSALVYGGISSDGTVTADGVVVDGGGVTLGFQTPIGLHQPSGVFGKDAITVVGTACEGQVTIHETGTSCSPGTPAAFRVSIDDGSVTEVDLGTFNSNPDAETYVTAMTLDDQVVVQVVQDGAASLHRLTDTGSEPIEAPPAVAACATQDTIYSLVTPATGPSGPRSPVTAVEPPATSNATIHRYTSAAGWSTVPADIPPGQLICTAQQLVVLTETGTNYVLNGDNVTSANTTDGYGSTVLANTDDTFYAASTDGVTFEIVDADGGTNRTVTTPGSEGTALLALLNSGRVTVVVDGRLEEVR
jgi:hypothetical protein